MNEARSVRPLADAARHVREALGRTSHDITRGYETVAKTKLGVQFLNTGVGVWFDKLSPGWKVGAALGAAMAGVQLARFFYHHAFRGDHDTPPPAYQGAYNRINGLRSHGWSDFGSGIRLNRVAHRPLMPARHSTAHRAYAGFAQGL